MFLTPSPGRPGEVSRTSLEFDNAERFSKNPTFLKYENLGLKGPQKLAQSLSRTCFASVTVAHSKLYCGASRQRPDVPVAMVRSGGYREQEAIKNAAFRARAQ